MIEKDFDTYIEINKSIVTLLNTGRILFAFLVRGVLKDVIRCVWLWMSYVLCDDVEDCTGPHCIFTAHLTAFLGLVLYVQILHIFISVINQLDAQNFILQQVYFMPLVQFRPPDDEHMCSNPLEA